MMSFIINLPIELSVSILNFLEIEDLINFKVVSSISLQITYDRRIILWQNFDMNEYMKYKIKRGDNNFTRVDIFSRMFTIGLGLGEGSNIGNVTDDNILKGMFRIHADTLTNFSASSYGITNQCIQYLMRFNNISAINLSYSNNIITDCLISFVNKFSSTLKSIKLYKLLNVSFEDHIIKNCILLEELDIKEGMELSQTTFISILKTHGHRLKNISIFYSTLNMTNYLLLSIVHYCPNLQSFHGSRISFDNDFFDSLTEDLDQTYIKEPMIKAGLSTEMHSINDLSQSLFDSLKSDLISKGVKKFYIDDLAGEQIGFDQYFDLGF